MSEKRNAEEQKFTEAELRAQIEKYRETIRSQEDAFNAQKEEYERLLAQAELTNGVLFAISKLYWLIFGLDLKNGTYQEIVGTNGFGKFALDGGLTSERFTSSCKRTVAPEFQEEMLEFLNTDTLVERLRDREEIFCEYMTVTGNWHIGRFIVQQRDENGNAVKALYVIRIINERKRREMEYRKKLLESAREAEKANSVKTDFLRRMSHDIRTPINAILGMIEISNHMPENYVRLQECRDKIEKASKYLLRLANNVLDMNNLISGEVVLENIPFDVTEIINSENALSESLAKERGVKYVIREGVLPHRRLLGSPLHLRQILRNIADNAVTYNKIGGSVEVSCNEIEYDGEKATLLFTCIDTGKGMSEEFQKHAFEAFSQERDDARTAYSGTGLGLTITGKLVELMNGKISLKSRLDAGTTVLVAIPFLVDQSGEKETSETQVSLKGRKVLLVEDNELNMEIAEFMLEQEGMSVTKAYNGAHGVREFAASAYGYFDFILMDIMMPEMNGMEAARTIRAMERPDAKTVPIFAMTANSFMEDVERSKASGMNEHICKPLNHEVLVRFLTRYCK